jgi:transposase InsO family protein
MPKNKTDLSHFLGLTGFYRRLIRDFSRISHPLTACTRKEHKLPTDSNGDVLWSVEERRAFHTLKKCLSEDPVVRHPDWQLPFVLTTDACKHGLGAVLTQEVPDAKGQKFHRVISYASRTTTPVEQNRYTIFELEMAAVAWATNLFRMYLAPPFGRKFTIRTDNSSVVSALRKTDHANTRVLKWLIDLSAFDFEAIHKAGKDNPADALSRCPLLSTCPYGSTSSDDAALDIPPVFVCGAFAEDENTAFFDPEETQAWDFKTFCKLQQEDKTCQKIVEKLREEPSCNTHRDFKIELKDGHEVLVYRGPRDKDKPHARLVVPEKLKAFLLHHFHGAPLSNHNGRDTVLRHLSQRYYWRNMFSDVHRWISACCACQCRKTPRPAHAGKRLSMCSPYPFHTVAADLVGRLTKTKNGYEYILVIVDTFSRWPIFVPLRSKSADEVALALYKHLLCVHGTPERLLTDRGSEFVNAGLAAMCKTWGIQKIASSPRHKQGNGHAERVIRWLNSSMTFLHTSHGCDWDEYLDAVAFAYRVSTCTSIGYSPYEILYARKPRMPDHSFFDLAPDNMPDFATERDYHLWASERLHTMFQSVRRTQSALARANRDRSRQEDITYYPGQPVLVWRPDQNAFNYSTGEYARQTAPGKWKYRWTGPHRIIRQTQTNNYDVEDFATRQVIHSVNVSCLWPFSPWSSVHPSTSPSIDRASAVPWACSSGTAKKDDFVAVALTEGFGIGRLLQDDDGTDLYFQWYSNFSSSWASTSAFKPGWLNADGSAYYGTRRANDLPYTSRSSGTVVAGEHALLHGFSLTKSNHLPANVYRAIRTARSEWD